MHQNIYKSNVGSWESLSCNRTAISRNPFGRRARSQRATIHVVSPPINANPSRLKHEEYEQSHESSPGVQPAGQDVVVALPPSGPVPVYDQISGRAR